MERKTDSDYELEVCDCCEYAWEAGSVPCHRESCPDATPETTVSGTVEFGITRGGVPVGCWRGMDRRDALRRAIQAEGYTLLPHPSNPTVMICRNVVPARFAGQYTVGGMAYCVRPLSECDFG